MKRTLTRNSLLATIFNAFAESEICRHISVTAARELAIVATDAAWKDVQLHLQSFIDPPKTNDVQAMLGMDPDGVILGRGMHQGEGL